MKHTQKQKKIVVIGGGTGVFTVLSGLRDLPYELTAVVSMADDGGSTGRLREEFGMLPPGDIRRALVALSHTDNKMLAELFSYRFDKGNGLAGHNFGNLMIAALERITGSFEDAVSETGKILGVQGRVLPVTTVKTSLRVELEDGRIVKGEGNIDVPKHDGNLKIIRTWLAPKARINPVAREAVLAADAVIIGPGDLYTSLVPNLLVNGMVAALKKTEAKVIYVVNLMTKFGETNGFNAADFAKVIESYVGIGTVDYCLVNDKMPSAVRLRAYAEELSEPVAINNEWFGIGMKLAVVDLLRAQGFLRHDSMKLAKAIASIISLVP